jgi:hypothetical protein
MDLNQALRIAAPAGFPDLFSMQWLTEFLRRRCA